MTAGSPRLFGVLPWVYDDLRRRGGRRLALDHEGVFGDALGQRGGVGTGAGGAGGVSGFSGHHLAPQFSRVSTCSVAVLRQMLVPPPASLSDIRILHRLTRRKALICSKK